MGHIKSNILFWTAFISPMIAIGIFLVSTGKLLKTTEDTFKQVSTNTLRLDNIEDAQMVKCIKDSLRDIKIDNILKETKSTNKRITRLEWMHKLPPADLNELLKNQKTEMKPFGYVPETKIIERIIQ